MKRFELITYLNEYLRIADIQDYGPQGLQVEAENEEIKKIALAVDVSPDGIRAAAAWGADMLLVHHGLFWRDVQPLVGPLAERIRLLLKNGINLYGAHLPLDAHPEVGNNAVLAQYFGVNVTEWWCAPTGTPLGIVGPVQNRPGLIELVQTVEQKLNTKARVLAQGPEIVSTMAIVSGFGADKIGEAQAMGADTFLTGETSHQNYWAAADYGINLIFAGHYATETVGVRTLGEHLAQRFDLEAKFFDYPTGM